MTESVAHRDPVEELAEEFLARVRRGERPGLSEYTAAHPELADEIRDLFPALVMMEEAKPAQTHAQGFVAPGPEVPPEQLGDYRILREIARGGMGVVYEAEQVALGRHVALKVLPAANGGDPLRLLRFRREARSAAKLHHTNIVPVFDVGSSDQVHYYAMQFIQGQGLDEVLQELRRLRSGEKLPEAPKSDLTASLVIGLQSGEFPHAPVVPVPKPLEPTPKSGTSTILTEPVAHYFRSVARLGVQAADALAYAHGQRVLHRDVKPSNLLLDRQGTLWLTDFGLAKDDSDDLTRTGDIVGTLRYMAPERFHGVSDPRTDVYALGVTLYEMLTLRAAFPTTDRVLLINQIAKEDPPRPRALDPTVPRDLETIVLKAIEKEPGRRYPTAAEMADDLRRFLSDRPIKARRASWREQAWRWCRRNRGVALSLSTAFAFLVLLVVGLSVGGYLVWRAKGDVETAKGNVEAAKSEVEQRLAEEKLAGYFQRIALADRELAVNHVARAEQLLADCPAELRRWEWHYLNRSRGRAPRELRHPHAIEGRGALSPNGRWVATAGRNGVVTVWDLAADPPTARMIEAHESACWNVAFSPDSRVLVSTSEEVGRPGTRGEARFWNPATGAEVRPAWDLGDYYFNAVAFSPDGRRLAVTRYQVRTPNDEVAVYDLATGQTVLPPDKLEDGAQGLAFSPDGALLASASADHVVRVYDAGSGRVVYQFKDDRPGRHPFWCVAFSPDGKKLAAAYGHENEKAPGGVYIWEVGTWQKLPPIIGPDAHGLVWGSDGRVATGEYDGSVRVWDAERGIELLTLRGHIDVVRSVAFTPDGYRLVSVGEDRVVRIWDATPVRDGEPLGDELATLAGHTNGVKTVAFHPIEPVLVSGGMDGRLFEWNARDWSAKPRALLTANEPVHAAVYEPNGEWLAAAVESATGSAVLGARDGAVRARLQLRGNSRPHRLCVSPDGAFLAGCDMNGEVVVWDAATGDNRHGAWDRPFARTGAWAYGIAFGPDAGRPLLAVVVTGAGVKVYHPATGREVAALHHPGGTGLAFNRDGTLLASVGWDNVVRVWRTDGWALVHQYRDPGGGPNSVCFSPDGTLLAWGGVDATVKVWKIGSDRATTLRGHRNWVWDVAFSPKGDLIASAGRDGTVKIWQTPTFETK